MRTARIRVRKDQAALLVVDIQPDFFPGGSLPVARANEILPPLRRLMNSRCFHWIVAAQDWHPRGHISVASSHRGRKPMDAIDLYGHDQTLWPDHCVQGTPGAELHRGLPWEKATAIIRKATDPSTDSYSAFRNNWNSRGNRPPTGLSGYLKDRGVDEVFLCGLALDFCVRWSAEDALQEDFRTFVIWDLCRSIDPASDAAVRSDLIHRGAKIISMRSLLPSH